ncbi:MAG TPA: N-acetyl-gamma-glutamyl-phosphate reductase [Capillimicrobium sp.]|nr:N-acetyl-gamma-glutamyl-phosphate reductase [Capillimicrobium sp.]
MGSGADGPSVAVLGASGFAGALAARLLWAHPHFDLVAVTSRSDAGRRLDDLYPHHRVPLVMDAYEIDELGQIDAAVVAYPHGAAAPTVAELHERGIRVVDLSADFRLRDVAVYEEWYVEHPVPELIDGAVYGLPELYRDRLPEATIVAGPGCFPTAAILGLAPIAPYLADVVIDAKSGVSGAGRAATEKTHFVSVAENVKPYGIGRHRHAPEIDQELAALGARDLTATFTPHLLPLDQGELLSCYATLTEDVDVHALYGERYADEPFVELVASPPGVRDVRETNFCRILVHPDERTGKVFVFSAIDNLWKGTASQAVQCLNVMFGFDESAGIR